MKKVRPGEVWTPSASATNAAIDAAEWVRRHEWPQAAGRQQIQPEPDMVRVRNRTIGNLDQWAVVELTDSTLDASAVGWPQGAPTLDATAPTGNGRIAVLAAPVRPDAFADAAVSGATRVKVDVLDATHKYARAVSGSHVLQSTHSNTAPAEILWVEDGLGEKWAIVRLGNSSNRVNIAAFGHVSLQMDVWSTAPAKLYALNGSSPRSGVLHWPLGGGEPRIYGDLTIVSGLNIASATRYAFGRIEVSGDYLFNFDWAGGKFLDNNASAQGTVEIKLYYRVPGGSWIGIGPESVSWNAVLRGRLGYDGAAFSGLHRLPKGTLLKGEITFSAASSSTLAFDQYPLNGRLIIQLIEPGTIADPGTTTSGPTTTTTAAPPTTSTTSGPTTTTTAAPPTTTTEPGTSTTPCPCTGNCTWYCNGSAWVEQGTPCENQNGCGDCACSNYPDAPCDGGSLGNTVAGTCFNETVPTEAPTTSTSTSTSTSTTPPENSCLYQCDGQTETWQLIADNCNGGNTCQIYTICDMLNDGQYEWSSCGA